MTDCLEWTRHLARVLEYEQLTRELVVEIAMLDTFKASVPVARAANLIESPRVDDLPGDWQHICKATRRW